MARRNAVDAFERESQPRRFNEEVRTRSWLEKMVAAVPGRVASSAAGLRVKKRPESGVKAPRVGPPKAEPAAVRLGAIQSFLAGWV